MPEEKIKEKLTEQTPTKGKLVANLVTPEQFGADTEEGESDNQYDEHGVGKVQDFSTEQQFILTLIRAWTDFEVKNETYKDKLIKYLMRLLFGQLIIVNAVIIACGFEWIKTTEDFLKWFIAAVVVELLGMIGIMVKFVFNHGRDKILDAIMEMMKKDSRNRDT